MITKIPSKVIVCVALLNLLAFQGPTIAHAAVSAHSCGSNWCSGSDSGTSTNIEGNGPQIYVGEVAEWQVPVTKMAFNQSAAQSAIGRAVASTPSGVGVAYYDFGNGPTQASAPVAGESLVQADYCFGWEQGHQAESNILNDYSTSVAYSYVIFFDMEITPTSGWLDAAVTGGSDGSYAERNRAVFNGFSDYVAGRTSANPSFCSGVSPYIFQYGVYSSPGLWHTFFDTPTSTVPPAYLDPASSNTDFCNEDGGKYGSLPNTFIWTNQGQNSSQTNPGTFDTGNPSTAACWFGSSNYEVGQQFVTSQSNDYDLFYVPQSMPVFGFNWGY